METGALLRLRSDDLGISDAEAAEWEPLLDERFVRVLLANLIRFEEALRELAS